jgi:hypothetical protein
MKKFYATLFCFCVFLPVKFLNGQCAAGYTQAQANWDHLDVYYNGGQYGTYISDAQEQNQRFAIGTNWFTMSTSSNALLITSEAATHTGELTGFTGDDVQFNPTSNGQSITISFNDPVLNARFVLYDIDRSAIVTVSAVNPSSTALPVIAVPEMGTILSITGAVSKTLTANNTSLANNSNQGSVTLTVAGTALSPVKSITITVNSIGSDAVFFLSDINACVTGSFPSNWHQGFNNEPFSGPVTDQPDYFLVTPDNNSCYMMDPATGRCWWIFTDASRNYMNSFAYDPQNKILYYISENVSLNSSNKMLKQYDFNTETLSVVINDIETTLGIPTFNSGVESAGAFFYDGNLYLGIEGGQSISTIRESIIYRIDLSTNTAYQVFATLSYSGTGIIHDWADFVVRDGELINYNSARVSGSYGNSSYTHYDLMTGASVRYGNPSPANKYSGQAGMNWSGNTYMIYDSVWQYLNGAIFNRQPVSVITVPGDPAPPNWNGNAGDASDPFRPKCDFGDAPATYDPNYNSPAVHERSEAIRIGPTWDREWLKRGVTTVEDIDDGVSWVPMLQPGLSSYVLGVSVYNNHGTPATLIAWLDINGNGTFEASEAITPITVPSSGANQNFWLYWPNTTNSFVNGQVTYLRIRMTSQDGGMTTSHATGYFTNGEVEDYLVLIDNYPLTTLTISYSANLWQDKHGLLDWQVQEDGSTLGYEVQKSTDGFNYENLVLVGSDGQPGLKNYSYLDPNISFGKTFYRLKFIGNNKFSEVRTVHRARLEELMIVRPNPVSDRAWINVGTENRSVAEVMLLTMTGKEIYRKLVPVDPGQNVIELPIDANWPNGTYVLKVFLNQQLASRKLIIHR